MKELRNSIEPPPYLTEEELQKVLREVRDLWLKRIVIFASMTGLRLGELLNLKWEDINLDTKTIIIKSSDNYRVKCGKMRVLPLNKVATDLLTEFPDRSGLVFRGKRGGIANGNFVSRKFREVIRSSDLDQRLHFHSLRHSFASLLVKKGTSLFQVQKLLGHSSSRVTEIYAHLQTSDMHQIVDRIGNIT